MEEEFKTPKPIINPSLLNAPQPIRSGPVRKDRNAKSHIEFIRMIESNADPLCRAGRPLETFSLEEVQKHSKENDAWIVLNGKVYDMTLYVNYHPGGRIIMSCAGKDGTNFFMRYHPWVNIENLIGKLQIGVLDKSHILL